MRNGEKLVLGLSALAVVVSVASAIFTALQAWTAGDTEVRQLRAYVDLTDIEVICPDCSNPNFNPRSLGSTEVGPNFVHIRFQNVGETPASNITFRINWQDVPGLNAHLPDAFKFPNSAEPQSATLFRSSSELSRDKREMEQDASISISTDFNRPLTDFLHYSYMGTLIIVMCSGLLVKQRFVLCTSLAQGNICLSVRDTTERPKQTMNAIST